MWDPQVNSALSKGMTFFRCQKGCYDFHVLFMHSTNHHDLINFLPELYPTNKVNCNWK